MSDRGRDAHSFHDEQRPTSGWLLGGRSVPVLRDGDLKFSQVGARQTDSASVFGDGRFWQVFPTRRAAAAARIGCGVGQRASRGTRPADADGALTLIR